MTAAAVAALRLAADTIEGLPGILPTGVQLAASGSTLVLTVEGSSEHARNSVDMLAAVLGLALAIDAVWYGYAGYRGDLHIMVQAPWVSP